MRKRKALLKAARAAGYDGADDLAALKAWIASDKGVDLTDSDGKPIDVDQYWNAVDRKSAPVTIEDDDAGDSDDAETKAAKAAKSAEREARGAENRRKAAQVDAEIHEGASRHNGLTPGNYANMAARKHYDRMAKLSDNSKGKPHFPDADTAVHFGAWFRSATFPMANYPGKAEDLAMVSKAGVTTTLTAGGALVPSDFVPMLISLKEERGAMRKVLTPQAMSRDVQEYPRRTAGLTVYAPGEATAITASDVSYDKVTLTAFKMGTLSRLSSELMNDSTPNAADVVIEEIAYAFADKEDECFFNGDGTSTYFHQQGVRSKIQGLNATIGNIAGIVSNSGINLWSEFTMAHFEDLLGRVPAYVRNPVFVCSKPFYWNVMRRLELALGGVTAAEGRQGVPPVFLGLDVIYAQVMPRVDADSTIHCLVGDFNMGAMFGEVRGGMTIAQSDQRYFDSDEIAVRGLQRVAMSVHSVGNASATASARVPGPICALASTT